MRYVLLMFMAFFLFACNASAQINAPSEAQIGSPRLSLPATVPFATENTAPSENAATNTESLSSPAFSDATPSPDASPSPSFADPSPAEPPQGVYGVFPSYQFQANAGYTFVRFYEVPGTTVNTNGFNCGITYYVKSWVGAEGEFLTTFGSLSGSNSHFLLAAGGARVRHSIARNVDVWAHALAGVSNFTPQTAYGGTHAFGYEVGGGVDINSHRRRWAYRIEGDAVGSFYFSTYQVSPKVSVGLVYNF